MPLNEKQNLALEMYCEWFTKPSKRKRPWFEISGPAGSGKTFLVEKIMDELGITSEQSAFMAYVGKATLALRLAGVNARTIHSCIYDLVNEYDIDEYGNVKKNHNGNPKTKMVFRKKPELNKDWIQLLIDEGGMVGDKIGRDILSYNLPTMILGDVKQLPPVMSKRIFLSKPDVELTQIMRQEEGSPIIYLSQLATHGIPIPYGKYGTECRVIRKKDLRDEDLVKADIIICGTNRMRDNINRYMRTHIQNIYEPHIVIGDKLICRQNKWDIMLNEDIALVNGLIGYVTNMYRETKSTAEMEINFRPEFCEKEQFKRVPINHNYPFLPYEARLAINPRFAGNKIQMEFGSCITCHLAQGSQYDNVIVYVENATNSLYFRQWFYTAITRAKKELTIVI